MNNKNSGIYMLYWDNTPHFYIGSSKNLKSRIKQHFYLFKSFKSSNPKIIPLLKEFGLPKFKIVENCTEYDLSKKEMDLVAQFADNEYLLNFKVNRRGRCMERDLIKSRVKNHFVPLNEFEYETLLKRSEFCGMTIDEYIRHICIYTKNPM